MKTTANNKELRIIDTPSPLEDVTIIRGGCRLSKTKKIECDLVQMFIYFAYKKGFV